MLFLYLIKKLLKKRWMVLALLYLEQVMFASLLALGLMKNGQQQHRQIRHSKEYMLADRMIKKLLHTVIRKLLISYVEICRKLLIMKMIKCILWTILVYITCIMTRIQYNHN